MKNSFAVPHTVCNMCGSLAAMRRWHAAKQIRKPKNTVLTKLPLPHHVSVNTVLDEVQLQCHQLQCITKCYLQPQAALEELFNGLLVVLQTSILA